MKGTPVADMSCKHLAPISLLLLFAACGDQSSSPVPQPIPSPVQSMIRVSTPVHNLDQTLVLGLPQAVAGPGKVHVKNTVSGAQVSVDASSSGSFSATIAADIDASLQVSFETDEGSSDWISLGTRGIQNGPSFEAPKYGGTLISAPDSQGLVTVSNQGTPPLINATPNMDLLVANADTAEVLSSVTDDQGIFNVQIAASTGDTIQILLVDPDQPVATSDFISGQVP